MKIKVFIISIFCLLVYSDVSAAVLENLNNQGYQYCNALGHSTGQTFVLPHSVSLENISISAERYPAGELGAYARMRIRSGGATGDIIATSSDEFSMGGAASSTLVFDFTPFVLNAGLVYAFEVYSNSSGTFDPLYCAMSDNQTNSGSYFYDGVLDTGIDYYFAINGYEYQYGTILLTEPAAGSSATSSDNEYRGTVYMTGLQNNAPYSVVVVATLTSTTTNYLVGDSWTYSFALSSIVSTSSNPFYLELENGTYDIAAAIYAGYITDYASQSSFATSTAQLEIVGDVNYEASPPDNDITADAIRKLDDSWLGYLDPYGLFGSSYCTTTDWWSPKQVGTCFLYPSSGFDYVNRIYAMFKKVFPFNIFFGFTDIAKGAIESTSSTQPSSVADFGVIGSTTINLRDMASSTNSFYNSYREFVSNAIWFVVGLLIFGTVVL